ncbi:MAG: sulfite exporter TauE/SafE family protein [Pseudomonadota bacterium]
MSLPVEVVLGAALVITLAYLVFGLTGFGSSITAVPLLAHLLPLKLAVPMMLIFDLCAALLLGFKNRSAIDRKELLRLVPYMLAGMALGVTVLVKAPESALLLILGIFVLAYSAWSLVFRPSLKPIGPAWSVPLGAAGGVFTALFGTGGPIYTIYLARRLDDKLMLRATITSLIFVSALARLVLFTSVGLYGQENLLWLVALLLPCALAGLYLGSRLHRRLPAQRVIQAVWAVLVIGGASLVWRGMAA